MDGVRQSVSNGILLSLIGAIGFTAASLLFMRPLLHLMNTPENIFAQAYEYISLISLGMVANVFYNLFSSYLRAVGNSRMPLVFLVLSACLNVVLDLILIINFKMGVAGAAIATFISQALSAVLITIRLAIDRGPLRITWKRMRFTGSILVSQLKLGIPTAVESVLFAITNIAIQAASYIWNGYGGSLVSFWKNGCRILDGQHFLWNCHHFICRSEPRCRKKRKSKKEYKNMPSYGLCRVSCHRDRAGRAEDTSFPHVHVGSECH